ncbi:MAG: FMN-binding glutamate synthase family protein [Gammaproteobacteria bacterium]
MNTSQGVVAVLGALLVLLIAAAGVALTVLYVIDRRQTAHAVRRNYPVIGRFRNLFEHLGEFFRQYFFAMDREELPFNRAQRSWAYRAAKNVDNTVAFGSTRNLQVVGTPIFANCAFPLIHEDQARAGPIVIGPGLGHPFEARSLFNISAMSYGSISRPAVLALSRGAEKAGCWLNTGEGGLSPYHLEGGADIVFQRGTAKNGVSDTQGRLDEELLREVMGHAQVRMLEIKLSQGAKPGKGGILPGARVTQEIADIRGIVPGVDALSPNRHPEIDSTAALLDMIGRIRGIIDKPVGFKCVFGSFDWVDELLREIQRRGVDSAPDFITVDGGDGGSGAAPMPLIDACGMPLRESLPLLVDKLNEHGLRERIKVVASGKLMVPSEVAWAMCAGADFAVSARGFMFALGCIQALRCNRNTCPTGITTHDPKLQRGLVPADKAQRVCNYHDNMLAEVGIIAHACGVSCPRDLARHHVRIVTPGGRSVPMNELYPAFETTAH